MADRLERRWLRCLVILGFALVLVVLLLVHLALMGPSHHDDSGCATCLTVIVAGIALSLGTLARSHSLHYVVSGRFDALPTRAGITSGRHPPSRSVVLRL